MKGKAKILAVAIITAIINNLMIKYGYKAIDYSIIFICLVTTEFIIGYNIGIRNKAIKSEKQRIIGAGLIIGAILTVIEGIIFIIEVIVKWRG